MKTLLVLVGIFMLCMASASAEIYKSVDSHGHVIYTDTPTNNKNMPVTLAPLTTYKAVKSTSTASDFANNANNPSKSSGSQDELAQEQIALRKAKKALSEGQSVRIGGEKNYAKYLARIDGLKQAVAEHEKRISALQSGDAN